MGPSIDIDYQEPDRWHQICRIVSVSPSKTNPECYYVKVDSNQYEFPDNECVLLVGEQHYREEIDYIFWHGQLFWKDETWNFILTSNDWIDVCYFGLKFLVGRIDMVRLGALMYTDRREIISALKVGW